MKKDYLIGAYEKAFPEEYSVFEMLKIAKDCGYDFFEISIDRTDKRIDRVYDKDYQMALLQAINDNHFPVYSICLSALSTYTLGNKDKQIVEKAKDIFRHTLEFAKTIGAKIIQIPGCDVPKFDNKDNITDELFRNNVKELITEAQKYDLIIGLENMENDYMDTVEKSMSLINYVNKPNFKLYSDAGNIYSACRIYQSDPIRDMDYGLGFYCGFHLKETRVNKYGGLFYGQGHVNFPLLVNKAYKLGIRNYVLEYWYTGNPEWLDDLEKARNLAEKWLKGDNYE